MDNTIFFYSAIIGFGAIYFLIWFDYKHSQCFYGGSSGGRDNWVLRILKNRAKAAAEKSRREPADICDY
jgi:hypothetical protein